MADSQPTASVPPAPEPVCVEFHHFVCERPATEEQFRAALRLYANGATDAEVLAAIFPKEEPEGFDRDIAIGDLFRPDPVEAQGG